MSKYAVQALIYQPELTHSVWTEIRHQCRGIAGIRRMAWREIESGRWVGYRVATIHEEHLGLTFADKLASKSSTKRTS